MARIRIRRKVQGYMTKVGLSPYTQCGIVDLKRIFNRYILHVDTATGILTFMEYYNLEDKHVISPPQRVFISKKDLIMDKSLTEQYKLDGI